MEDNTKRLFTEPETEIVEFEDDIIVNSGYCALDCTGNCKKKDSE